MTTKLKDIEDKLTNDLASIRCKELADYLTQLGFEVRDCKKGNHKIFIHEGIPGFRVGNYDCGHGKNPVIKRVYIRKILKLYKLELKTFLGEDKND